MAKYSGFEEGGENLSLQSGETKKRKNQKKNGRRREVGEEKLVGQIRLFHRD